MAQLAADVSGLGRIPVMTVTDGNCAFDTMLFCKGLPRHSAERKVLRMEVVESIRDSCGDERWQRAFRELGEGEPDAPQAKVVAKDSGKTLALAVPICRQDVSKDGSDSLALAAEEATLQPPLPPPVCPPTLDCDVNVVAVEGALGSELESALLHHASPNALPA